MTLSIKNVSSAIADLVNLASSKLCWLLILAVWLHPFFLHTATAQTQPQTQTQTFFSSSESPNTLISPATSESDVLKLNLDDNEFKHPLAPVIDTAHIFSNQEQNQIIQQLLALSETGRAYPAVVTVKTTGDESIFDYGMRLADHWRLGSAKQDNGLIILVAVDDREIYIFTGYGLEGALPDAVLSRIIDQDITPKFKQSKYAEGILKGIDSIEQRINPTVINQAKESLSFFPKNRITGNDYYRDNGIAKSDEIADRVLMPLFAFLILSLFLIFCPKPNKGTFLSYMFKGFFLSATLIVSVLSLLFGGSYILTLLLAILFGWVIHSGLILYLAIYKNAFSGDRKPSSNKSKGGGSTDYKDLGNSYDSSTSSSSSSRSSSSSSSNSRGGGFGGGGAGGQW